MGLRRHSDITIRGVTYPTAAAAAAAHGVIPDTIRLAVRRGTLDRVGTGCVGVAPMPVLIRGFRYPDARAAALALGVTPAAIWQALSQGRIDTVGLGLRCQRPHRSRSITIGGVTYASHAAADRALGFSAGYVAHSLKSGRRSAIERIVAAGMRQAGARMAT